MYNFFFSYSCSSMYSTYLFGVLVSSFDVIACCSPFNFLFSVLINLFVQQSNMFSPIVLISYICVCVLWSKGLCKIMSSTNRHSCWPNFAQEVNECPYIQRNIKDEDQKSFTFLLHWISKLQQILHLVLA